MSVYVVSHKDFDVKPFKMNDEYQLLFVGSAAEDLANKYGAKTDSSGDNISSLNSSFCELTALYWIWKNSADDIAGLVHYRRFFSDGDINPLLIEELPCLDGNSYVVPEKYWLLQSVEKHYASHHDVEDLKRLRLCIADLQPAYLSAFDEVMRQNYLYPYNMFIANREALDSYCSWLFPILFEFRDRDTAAREDSYQRRVIGFLAERLCRVYLLGSKSTVIERPVWLTEKNLKRTISMKLASLLQEGLFKSSDWK